MRELTHDPYRAKAMVAPQLPRGVGPAFGRFTVLAYVDRYPPVVNAGAEWMLHHMLRPLVESGSARALVATETPGPYVFEGVEVFPRVDAERLAVEADVLVGHLAWTRQVVTLAAHRSIPLVYLMHNDNQVNYWRLDHRNLTAMVWNSEWMRGAHSPTWDELPSTVCRPPTRLRDYGLDRDPGRERFVTLVNPNAEKGAGTFYETSKRMLDHRFLVVEGGYGTQVRPPKDAPNVERQGRTMAMRDDVYARTRILFVPSSYESWGRVATEALCSGIPVVAHPTAGLVESLGSAGIFVDRKDVDGWVAAVRDLDDPGRYAAASAAARARAGELDALAESDLAGWETLLRRCVALRRSDRRPGSPESARTAAAV